MLLKTSRMQSGATRLREKRQRLYVLGPFDLSQLDAENPAKNMFSQVVSENATL